MGLGLKYKLSELIDIKHGYAFKGEFFIEQKDGETNNILLTPGNISIGGGFNKKRLRYYSDLGPIPNGYILKYDDIIVNMTDLSKAGDTLGFPAKVPKSSTQIFLHNQRLGKVVNLKPNILDTNYLYYLFQTSEYRHHVLSTASGTTVRHTSPTKILDFVINLPEINDQITIANILSSFDDKIEINNAIIANLEEQAQAIFKSWFMDSALFQDEEYETKKLGELFEFIKGKKPKTISEVKKEGFVPYLVKKYIDGDEATFTSSDDGILIDDLDIFMLMDGANSGNIYYGYHGILGSTFSFLKNVNEMVNEYIYWYLLINQESVKNQNTGSAIPHANKDYINNLEVALPIDIETNKVLKRLKDIRLYTINIRRENNKLLETRDTLLPKLMSGEIRVEEAIEVEEM